jgi:O-antigen ligase
VSLFVGLDSLPVTSGIIGSLSYYLRFVAYALLMLPFWDLKRDKGSEWVLQRIVGVGVILTLLGYVQLAVMPDFSQMVQYGWDPHQGRMLSTWFDPNFLGGFLGMSLLSGLGLLFDKISLDKNFWQKKIFYIYLVSVGVIFSGLILTYSRSALLAFLVGFLVLAFLRAKKALIVAIIIGALVFAFSPRLQERVIGAFQVDVTASLRIQNWLETLDDIEKNPWLGVGYNTLKYRTINPQSLNSSSGRDSSLLLVWLTTGLVGAILYIGWWVSNGVVFIDKMLIKKKALKSRHNSEKILFSAIGLAVIVQILTHSMFVNSLFFVHILVFILLFLA